MYTKKDVEAKNTKIKKNDLTIASESKREMIHNKVSKEESNSTDDDASETSIIKKNTRFSVMQSKLMDINVHINKIKDKRYSLSHDRINNLHFQTDKTNITRAMRKL